MATIRRQTKKRINRISKKSMNKRTINKTSRRGKRSRKNKTTRKTKKYGGENLEDKYLRQQQKHNEEQQKMDLEKEQKNIIEADKNKSKGLYLEPFNEWIDEVDYINQENDLNIANRQREFNDRMDMEADDGPVIFGGKISRRHKKRVR